MCNVTLWRVRVTTICRGNATMHSVFIAKVHVTVNSIGILSVARKIIFKVHLRI